jgi:prophage regulatory protein
MSASGTAKPRQKPNNKITYVPKPLPEEGFVRLATVLAVLGISRTAYLEGAKAGKFPKGKLLSKRCRVYPVSEIRALLASLEEEVSA